MGLAAEVVAPSSSIRTDGGCPVVQVNDLSRSLAVFDPISTLVVVVEMSKASWLVSERRCSWCLPEALTSTVDGPPSVHMSTGTAPGFRCSMAFGASPAYGGPLFTDAGAFFN